MSEITVNTKMSELFMTREFAPMMQYLIYSPDMTRMMAEKEQKKEAAGAMDEAKKAQAEQAQAMQQAPISALQMIGWSPEGIVRGANTLRRMLSDGSAQQYFVYTKEECEDDPQKKDVNMVRMEPKNPDPDKPYVLICAGGSYQSVCSLVEGYPAAVHFLEAGYQVFEVTYRVGGTGVLPKPMEDVAACLRFIAAHADEFSLRADHYLIGGFSAGANLANNWGLKHVGYEKYGLPKPKAIFPIYTVTDLEDLKKSESGREFLTIMLGEDYTDETLEKYDVKSRVDADYPPCFLCCGKADKMVSCKNSEVLKKKLDALGVPCMFVEGETADHGFGDGTGTDVEGWPEKAIAFFESLES